MKMRQDKIISLVVFFCFLISFLAYGVHAQELEKSKLKNLLSLSLEELLDVEVISAGKKPEKISDVPASVVYLTREEIETYGYSTLTKILEHIPGLYFIDSYEELNMGVRGFISPWSNKHTIILINGMPQLDAQASYNSHIGTHTYDVFHEDAFALFTNRFTVFNVEVNAFLDAETPYSLKTERTFGGDLKIIPSLAAIVELNEKHIFKLMYGEAIIQPSFAQENSTLNNPEFPEL